MRGRLALICLCLTGCAVFDAPTPYRDRDAASLL